MRYTPWLIFGLLMSGCETDFGISENKNAVGVANPPSVDTPVKTDVITQVTTPKVDILWVIDDSCSMSEEQAKLATNFDAFMNFFVDSGLDWHIGVVSTDTEASDQNGRLQGAAGYRYINTDTPSPVQTFAAMATLGINGAIDERGRRGAWKALTEPRLSGYNSGFYREEASLHVITITDEDDASGNQPTRNEFIQFLLSLKQDPEMVTYSSIVGPVGGCATADPGTEYLAVTNAVGGIKESICEDDWVPVLEALGIQAAGLRREYFLSEMPVPGTLDVWVVDGDYVYDGVNAADLEGGADIVDLCEQDICFTYDYDQTRNSILMSDFVPGPLAEVNIRYELLSGYKPDEDAAGGAAPVDTGN